MPARVVLSAFARKQEVIRTVDVVTKLAVHPAVHAKRQPVVATKTQREDVLGRRLCLGHLSI